MVRLLFYSLTCFSSMALANEQNYLGVQVLSHFSPLPGIHLNFEREIAPGYGLLANFSGHRWNAGKPLKDPNGERIWGFGLKAEPRKYFRIYYIGIPIAFTSFDKTFYDGGYQYISGGLGLGRKWLFRKWYMDTNIQAMRASKQPAKDLEKLGRSEEGGHAVGIDELPAEYPWLYESLYPNMNLEFNVIFGLKW